MEGDIKISPGEIIKEEENQNSSSCHTKIWNPRAQEPKGRMIHNKKKQVNAQRICFLFDYGDYIGEFFLSITSPAAYFRGEADECFVAHT